jgi:hypothetical protein
MRLGIFCLSLAVLTGCALWTVDRRSRAMRRAYELGSLRQHVREAERKNRALRAEAARLRSPSRLFARLEEMNLGLVEPVVAAESRGGSR